MRIVDKMGVSILAHSVKRGPSTRRRLLQETDRWYNVHVSNERSAVTLALRAENKLTKRLPAGKTEVFHEK